MVYERDAMRYIAIELDSQRGRLSDIDSKRCGG